MTLVLEEEDTSADMIRIILATRRPELQDMLEGSLHSVLAHAEACVVDDLSSLLAATSIRGAVDVVLLDLATPSLAGLAGLLYLRLQRPSVPVVVVSPSDDSASMRACIEAGAAGCVCSGADSDLLHEAIRMVLDGEIWTSSELDLTDSPDFKVVESMRRLASLTPQQLRVLTMLFQNLLNKQIAFELNVSEATVKAHVSAILQKLNVEGRCQAVHAVTRLTGAG